MRESSKSLLRVDDDAEIATAGPVYAASTHESADAVPSSAREGDDTPFNAPSHVSEGSFGTVAGEAVGMVEHDSEEARPRMVSDTRELKRGASTRGGASMRRTVRVRMKAGTLPGFDPIERLRLLTQRENRIGMSLGLAGALLVHGAGAAHGFSSLLDLDAFSVAIRNAVLDDVRATYAVEVAKPPPPAPVQPQPEPEPEKPQPTQRVPSQPAAAPAEPPPAPAQAGKVLTSAPDPSEPLDLTDQGFVTGEGDKFVGGVTAAKGTSKVAVHDSNAQLGGVPGGKGTAPAPPPPPPPPKQDLSRPATPASTNWFDCGFPAEADVEQIDFMKVSVVVTVGTDGRAQNVTVLKDPGYGFGRLAKACALRKTYNVGLDSNGRPAVTTSPPIQVKFTR